MITMKLQDVFELDEYIVKSMRHDGAIFNVEMSFHIGTKLTNKIKIVVGDLIWEFEPDTEVQVELIDYDTEIAKLIEAKAKLDNWLKMKGYENE